MWNSDKFYHKRYPSIVAEFVLCNSIDQNQKQIRGALSILPLRIVYDSELLDLLRHGPCEIFVHPKTYAQHQEVMIEFHMLFHQQ